MTDKTQLDIAFFYMVCTQLESDGGAKLTFLGNPPPPSQELTRVTKGKIAKDRNLRIIIERLFSFFLKKFSTTRCILPILQEYTSEFRKELMKTAVPAYLQAIFTDNENPVKESTSIVTGRKEDRKIT